MSSLLDDQLPPPRQDRSRATYERIIQTFERLLRTKSFDQITTSELAKASKAALPSIYARFKDKNALLLAAHERFKARRERDLAQWSAEVPTDWASLRRVLSERAEYMCEFYRTNRNLLRSALMSDSELLKQRVGDGMRRNTIQMARTMMMRADLPEEEAFEAGRRTMAIIYGLLHERLIFGDIDSALVRSEEELHEDITTILVIAAERLQTNGMSTPA